MTTGMIVFWVVVGVLLLAWWLVIQAKHPIDAPEENNEAPYKLETPRDVAVFSGFADAPIKREGGLIIPSDTPPKRKYTKRSPYWTSGKLEVKMAKARKARRKQNRKLK